MTKKKDSFDYEKAYRKSVLKISKSQTELKQLKHELVVRDKIIEIQDEEISLNKALKDEQPLITEIITGDIKDRTSIVPIINIGDMHVESNIDPKVVLGLNKSNPDIVTKRVHKGISEANKYLGMLELEFDIKRVVIQFLGDNITNYIHDELKKTNILTPFQAVFAARDIIINSIKSIADNNECPITAVFIRGNHSRNALKKEYSVQNVNSFEYSLYNMIIEYFKNSIGYEHVNFILPDSEYAVLKIFSFTTTTSHGDHFKYAGGIGGLQMPMMRWDYKLQTTLPANKRYIGHWHTFFNTKRINVSSSICGYDAFALSHNFEFEPPSINIDICHIEHGFIENRLIVLPTFM